VTTLSLLTGSFFGGIYSTLVPLSIIFLSDIYFGNTTILLFTWSAFILIGLFGTLLRMNSKYYFFKITGMGIYSALFFYFYTNFGWWLISGMYPMTFQGLTQCYLAGIPFLKNQLFSIFIFVPIFSPLFSLFFNKYLIKGYRSRLTTNDRYIKGQKLKIDS